MEYTIQGEIMQVLEIVLQPEEAIKAEPGAMVFMQDGIRMQTKGGDIAGGIRRFLTGEKFFLTTFSNPTDVPLSVAFAAPYPGTIIPFELNGESIICQRGAFLCSEMGIEVKVAFTKKISAGLFGKEGFVLQKISGTGTVFIHAGGVVVERVLEEGEVLKVDPSCIVAFSEGVEYGIAGAGGIRNVLFGGEGLFLATLKGPGTVYLQSLPFNRLVEEIMGKAQLLNKE